MDTERSKAASRSGIWEIEHRAAAADPCYEALDRLCVFFYLLEKPEPLEDELSRRLQQEARSDRSDLAGPLGEPDRVALTCKQRRGRGSGDACADDPDPQRLGQSPISAAAPRIPTKRGTTSSTL